MPRIPPWSGIPSRWRLRIAAAAVAAAVGAVAGVSIKDYSTRGDLQSLMAPLLWIVIGGVSVGLLAVAAITSRTGPRGMATVLVSAVVGLVASTLIASSVASGYVAPVESAGRMTVRLDGAAAATWEGRATCMTEANGPRIATVDAGYITRLEGHEVWVRLSMPTDANGPGFHLEVLQPNSPDSVPPFEARVYRSTDQTVLEPTLGAERRTGSIDFRGLRLGSGPAFDLPGRPMVLEGTIEWACELSVEQGGPDPHVTGRLDGSLVIVSADTAGTFGVDIPMSGDCDDVGYGISYWGADAVARDGRPARLELQVDRDVVRFALFMDPESKETDLRLSEPNQLTDGGPDWDFVGALKSEDLGELEVIAHWTCRP